MIDRLIEPTAPAAAPTGWKLVPIEPTPEMLAASWANAAPRFIFTDHETHIAAAYRAMLEAAPAEPAERPGTIPLYTAVPSASGQGPARLHPTGASWIGVDERLPEYWLHCIVASFSGVEPAQFVVDEDGPRFMRDAIHDMTEEVHEVTHWMPFPEAPAERHDGGTDSPPERLSAVKTKGFP